MILRGTIARLVPLAAIMTALLAPADDVEAQQVVGGLLVPSGQVVTGPVFRRDGTSVPSITTGADANLYIGSTAPTASFVAGSPAAVVITSAPTQYARVYTSGITNPVGGFIAPSSALRGKTAQQVRDFLALPYLPDSLTLVKVPAGTCILFGTAAPIVGSFPANPPSIPTPGPWGNGGTLQGTLIGTSNSPNCQNPSFLPAASYFNRQALGGAALAYRPNAGIGNTYAVAAALDAGAFPAQFSDMDTIYNALDVLNDGTPGALQAALKQLDGESYADFGYARLVAARAFLESLHGQMRAARQRQPITSSLNLSERPAAPSDIADLRKPLSGLGPGVQRTVSGGVWVTPYGAMGSLYGDAATHSASYSLYGFSGGADIEIIDDLRLGGAVGYSNTGLSTSIPASGTNEAVSIAAYASYAPAPWYIDAAVGYAYNWGSLTRTIAFPGILRTAQGNPTANQFLGSAEAGRGMTITSRLSLTPFARLEVTAAGQNAFTETGAGAIGLAAQPQSTTGVRSILGTEIGGSLALTESQHLAVALRLGWAHDYADLSGALTASFAGKPDTSFTVTGPMPDRNAATVGINLNLPLPLGRAFITYDANLAQSYTAHAAMFGLQIAF